MADANPLIAWYRRVSALPGGKALFSRTVCLRAPYFGSIKPGIERLESGRVDVSLPKRRAVQNHIGTVHAIAMCNACELAAGLVTEASIPRRQRWIPKGMTVDYVAKATTDLVAVATLDSVALPATSGEVVVPVTVTDSAGQVVLRALITMWLTEKPLKA